MRKFIGVVFKALVVVVFALGSMLITMRLAIHGREVSVPRLVGLTMQEAQRNASAEGLQLSVEGRFYSTEIPAGSIVSQDPPQNVKVRRGFRVRVAESLGGQQVVIPNVVGDSPRTAELNVRRRGLELGATAVASLPDQPPDQVIAQSPPANATGVVSPKVSILVTAPAEQAAYVMPDFIGIRADVAANEINSAGLKLGSVSSGLANGDGSAPEKKNGSALEGIVVRQTPAPGQRVTSGSVVTLETARQ